MTTFRSLSLPALRGGLLALLAALLFGVSTPLLQLFGQHAGPFTTAACLYAGAVLAGGLLRQPAEREAQMTRADLPRLTAMAAFGAIVAPVALAWGLQHTGGTGATLMLTMEALFTAVLARLLYREVMDRRVWTAMLLLLLGGILLALDQAGRGGEAHVLGLTAVVGATVAWGVDNTLSRGLADRDPGQVVLGKAALGAAGSVALALIFGEHFPPWSGLAGLLAVGATGYGLSLRFYLLAQRAFGAARTGSVFAFAPFIGAALAIALGDRTGGWGTAIGAVLMMAGVAVHLAEAHSHEHLHEALDHEHAHSHEDGHHDHVHNPMPAGPHSHAHVHSSRRHSHAHVPDLHHMHSH